MRNLTLKTLSAGVLLALAGTALADSKNTSFQVTANVQGNCVIAATPLAFGAFNGQAAKDAESVVEVRCTKDHPYAIGLDGGVEADTAARKMRTAGGDKLEYSLYSDLARTVAWGNLPADDVNGNGNGLSAASKIEHRVYGRIPASVANEDAKVGAGYTDTVQVTVTF